MAAFVSSPRITVLPIVLRGLESVATVAGIGGRWADTNDSADADAADE
jgi:hypothetical protein